MEWAENYGVLTQSVDGNYEPEGDRLPAKRALDPVRRRRLSPHPKAVALFEYLIRTYTNPGELVLDTTASSGTTAIAAENTDRLWICIERDESYATKAIG